MATVGMVAVPDEPGYRTIGAGDNDTYQLYDMWNGVHRIHHVSSGREGIWFPMTAGSTSGDGVFASIKWADGEEETLTANAQKLYFSSKPEKAYDMIKYTGPVMPC